MGGFLICFAETIKKSFRILDTNWFSRTYPNKTSRFRLNPASEKSVISRCNSVLNELSANILTKNLDFSGFWRMKKVHCLNSVCRKNNEIQKSRKSAQRRLVCLRMSHVTSNINRKTLRIIITLI